VLIPAILCSWLVLGIEWLVVLLLKGNHMAGLWEVQNGSLLLLPIALSAGALSGLCAVPLWNSLRQAEQRHTARLQLAAYVALLSTAVAFAISGGRHFAAPGVRVAFLAVAGSAAMLLVYWCGPALSRRFSRSSSHAVAFAVALCCIALELCNRFVLVRLYPEWHALLALFVLLLAPGLAWRREVSGKLLKLAVLTSTAIALATLVPSARRLSTFDNFRWVLLEQAPLLGQGVRLDAALLSALDEWAPRDATRSIAKGAGSSTPEAASPPGKPPNQLDWRGRDILLVTMDAVRADHVGAYGYPRPTTPHLDALARDGVVFEQAYCATPHTSYSLTSMLTGKYLRPLLLQGTGEDSATLADVLRVYGYVTAAFYPPAVFFIDRDRFARFEQAGLGFEYRKVEFMEGEGRVAQVADYLRGVSSERRVFLWVHLFAPHEPYEAHPEHDFGMRDLDRYDSEVAFTDATVGKLVALLRQRDPRAVAIVTADHGEEFGDHGGRYHGSSVYDEQVRVPLVISIPDSTVRGRVPSPVQTIDLFSTLHSALHIPLSPKIRGRDLSGLITQPQHKSPGFAFAETDEQTLLAQDSLRLICERKVGACRLFDVASDAAQQRDIAQDRRKSFSDLRDQLRELNASHGEYERRGASDATERWPAAILRGLTGDADAAADLAGLLDDSNVAVRRKASELLFRLHNPDSAAALRLSMTREEDAITRRYAALALTRLGQGAPLVYDLLSLSSGSGQEDLHWRRWAALVLAETGDARGEKELLAWWTTDRPVDFEDSRALIAALARIKSRDAAWSLAKALGDVRLRPYLARALAAIGEETARGPLLAQLEQERYHGNRAVLLDALLALGAKGEIEMVLRRFLGVPDPVENGVAAAVAVGLSERLGGPAPRDLKRLMGNATLGEKVRVVVPKPLSDAVDPHASARAKPVEGLRLILRVKSSRPDPGWVRVGRPEKPGEYGKSNTLISRKLSLIHPTDQLQVEVPSGTAPREIFAPVPPELGLAPGRSSELVLLAAEGVELLGFAIVPLAPELPPPAPEPWSPSTPVGPGPAPH
jgi:arylsulfatase A-like enzyme